MKRKASAEWIGTLKEGNGKLTTGSGALSSIPYTYRMRFEDEAGTNPEELVGAAHAGCFSMALSGELVKMGLTPGRIETRATVGLDRDNGGWSVKESHLEVKARVPGASPDQFVQAAEAAKSGCPISRLLNAKVTMDARLVSEELEKERVA